MKARVKHTGEWITVNPCNDGFYDVGTHDIYEPDELEFAAEFDWQSFRRDAAKDAMTGMMANADFWKQVWSHNRVNGRCDYPSEIAHFAISCADELIKALQNG